MDQQKGLKQIFWQGVMVELFNPKTMLFFFAFLLQFVGLSKGYVASQMLVFGFLFASFATAIDTLYALLAASVRRFMQQRRWFMRGQYYIESGVYIGLGLVIALSGSKNE